MTTDTRQGFLEVSSTRSSQVEEVFAGKYHLAVAASSWDNRSVVLAKSKEFFAESGVLLNFKKKDKDGLSQRNEEKLSKFFGASCRSVVRHEVEASHLGHNWRILRSALATSYQRNAGPISLFVDLSTIPRYLSLGLFGFGVQQGLIDCLVFGYSEGDYASFDGPSHRRQEFFTEGGWTSAAIPGLSGEWEPYRHRHYVVGLGFEGTKTRQLVSRSEPDKVSVLFPDPPVKEGYELLTQENNKELLREFGVPEERIVRSHAADVSATVEKLKAAELEDFESENVTYVCCGTKPHSLAFAIRASLLQEPAVVYTTPESHRVSDIRPNGIYWKYAIKDLSAI